MNLCGPATYLIGCEQFSTTGVWPVEVGGVMKTLDLTIGTPSAPTTVNAEVEQGKTYLFGCQQIPTASAAVGDVINKSETYSNITGCDSVVNLNLKVVAAAAPCTPDEKVINAEVKQGETFLWVCERIETANETVGKVLTREVTLKNVAGCDSVVKLNLTVVAATAPCTADEVIVNAEVKKGEVYLWQCEAIETANAAEGDVLTREVTLKNIAGCDSIVKLNLTVVAATAPCTADEVIVNAEVKQGEIYLWQCEQIETANAAEGDVLTREVTLKNVAGCDSVVKLNLTVVAATAPCTADEVIVNAEVKKGDVYLWQCEAIETANAAEGDVLTREVTLKNVAGCDSVVKLNLTVVAATAPCTTDEVTIKAEIKKGEVYLWQCEAIETANAAEGDVLTRETTLKNIAGCDSVVKLNLTVVAATAPCTTDEVTIKAEVKKGEVYLWQCEAIETANAAEGDVLTRETTLKNIAGCDSVVKLNLTVVAATAPCTDDEVTVNAEVKQGDVYLWQCEQIKTDDANEGDILTREVTLKNIAGCDSVVKLNLTVVAATAPCTVDEVIVNAEVKKGEIYLWQCEQIETANAAEGDVLTREVTLKNVAGCDSVVKLELTVVSATIPEVSVTIKKGETFLLGCTQYNEEFDGIVDVDGQQLHLYLNFETCDKEEVTVTAAVKEGETYLWQCEQIVASKADVNADGFIVRTANLKNVNGCDSIVTLKLTVNDACDNDEITVTAAVKEGETYLWQCEQIVASKADVNADGFIVRTANLKNVNGCDSIVTLKLAVNDACKKDEITIAAAVKEGETYLWQCEQIVASKADVNADGYIVRTANLKNIGGCDSIVTLNLTVNDVCVKDSVVVTAEAKQGEVYLWQCKQIETDQVEVGKVIEDVYYGLKNINGCDSIVTLNLTVVAKTDNCPTMMNPLPALSAQAGHILDVTAAEAAIMQYYDDEWNDPADPNKHNVTAIKWSVDGVSDAESAKVFSGDTLARTWAKKDMTIRVTLVAGDECDISGVTTITVADVESYTGTVTDTVCAGDSYAGKQIDNFETWTASKQINRYNTDNSKVLSFYDSIYTYNIYVFNTVIPQPSADVKAAQEPKEGKAFDGSALLDDVKTQVAADKLFARNAVLAIEIKVDDAWQALGPDNDTPAEGTKTLELRISGTSDCGDLTPAEFTLDVAKKDEPVIEPVTGAETVAVCPGDSFLYGDGNYYKLGKYDITLKSAVTGGDSIVTLTINEYNNVLPKLNLDSMPHAVCGRAFNISMISDNIESQIKADETFSPNVKLSWQVLGADGRWTSYTNGAMPAGVENISLRMIATSDCGVLDTLKLTMPIETPSPELLSDHDGLDAGWKYKTWVLMINLNDIRATYNIDPAPENVVWYRMAGSKPDQTVDEKLGTGHYYTEGKALEGDYYAVIELAPTEKDPCGSVWRTVTIECRSTSAAPQLYPTRVAGGEAMHLISLDPAVESSVRIYDAAGRLLKNITSQGEHELLIPAENMQGIYMVKVESETQKAVLRYVVVK